MHWDRCRGSDPIDQSIRDRLRRFTSVDAFNRLRTSHPQTLLDISHTIGKNGLLMTESTSGDGSSTYRANESAIDMAVTNNTDQVIRQSRRYAIYQPRFPQINIIKDLTFKFASRSIIRFGF